MTGRGTKEASRATITIGMLHPSTSYCRPMAVFFGRWLVMAQVGAGCFLGIAEALNGPKQDNYSCPQLAVRRVNANTDDTKVSFRIYIRQGLWFNIAHDSYLTANGKKYKLTAADGIKLDEDNTPQVKAYTVRAKYGSDINYCDFTLAFEPFDTIPTTFDFMTGDGEDDFVIRNVSVN